jgi:hypothetical protein
MPKSVNTALARVREEWSQHSEISAKRKQHTIQFETLPAQKTHQHHLECDDDTERRELRHRNEVQYSDRYQKHYAAEQCGGGPLQLE